MPGKHAPATSRSFYLSVARNVGTVLAAIGVVIVVVLIAVDSGDEGKEQAAPTGTASPRATATGSTTPTPGSDGVRAREETTVLVLNSTERQGLAALVSADLTALGYDVKDPTNASGALPKTTIYVRAGAFEEAERLRQDNFKFLGPGQIVEADASSPGTQQEAMLTVVLGADFPGQPSPSPSPTSS